MRAPQRLGLQHLSQKRLSRHLPATFPCAVDCPALPAANHGRQRDWLQPVRKPPRRLLLPRPRLQLPPLRPPQTQAHPQILQLQVRSLPRRKSHRQLPPVQQPLAQPVQLLVRLPPVPLLPPGRSHPVSSAIHLCVVDCLVWRAGIHGLQRALHLLLPSRLQSPPNRLLLLQGRRLRLRRRLNSHRVIPLRLLLQPLREQQPSVPVRPVPQLRPQARTIRQISPLRTRSQPPPRRLRSRHGPDCRSPQDPRRRSRRPNPPLRRRTSRPRSRQRSRPTSLPPRRARPRLPRALHRRRRNRR